MTRCARCGGSIPPGRRYTYDDHLDKDFCDEGCHREYIEEHFDEHMRWYREMNVREVYD